MEAFVKLFRSRCEREQVQPSSLADKAIINAVEFSHAYLFFYGQLEKANLMLQGVIDNASKPLDDVRMQFFFKNPINDHARESSLRGQTSNQTGTSRGGGADARLCSILKSALTLYSNRVSAHFIIHQARVQWHHLPYQPPWDQRIPVTLRCLFLKLCIWVHLLVRHR